jgi:uncharacterized protein
MELDSYTFVLLRRPTDAPELPEHELDELQERHLAYLAGLRERGVLAVAGPFVDQPDETLRGFCLYRVDIADARALAEQDPSVQAGRLTVDVMTWRTRRGAISFSSGS